MWKKLCPMVCLVFASFFSLNAQATWVGVMLFGGVVDHVHVIIAKDADSFDDATALNIWSRVPVYRTSFAQEMRDATKYIIFKSSKSVTDIEAEWTTFYTSVLPQRSLVSKNCAYASTWVLKHILGLRLPAYPVLSRTLLGIELPNFGVGIPIPDSVLDRLVNAFNRDKITYYTERHEFLKEGIDRFLERLYNVD